MKVVKIKNTWLYESDLRLDASYHLSDGVNTKRVIDNFSPYPTISLKSESNELFKGDIHKRVYVESSESGLPFYTASDLFKADINPGKFLSKKYSPHLKELELKKDWILITRSGTLGKVFYTTSDYEGKIGTDDLVRINPSEKNLLRGYLYAFLSSKFGYGLLTQSSYGGVVKHIEPHHVEGIEIPILPKSQQIEIHTLIMDSVDLRVKANTYLKEAQSIVVNAIGYKPRNLPQSVSYKTIFDSHQKRFEAQYFTSKGFEIREHIKKGSYKYLKDLSKEIFRPGIFKRHYVEKGIEFLGGSDIGKNIPKSDKKLSISQTKHLNEMIIKEDWILVTCGGTIGNSVLVNGYLAEKTASQHILRVVADGILNGYLYAFMSSELGFNAIQSFTYGSVIPTIEPHHLGLLPIPIIEETLMTKIHHLVMNYKEFISSSIQKELKAIELVEKEIVSWQK